MLTGDELMKYSGRDLVEVLKMLRPTWFRANPTRMQGLTADDIVVYIDGSRMGGLAHLRDVPVTGVMSIRYYSPSEAHGRYGPGHLQGALAVATTR